MGRERLLVLVLAAALPFIGSDHSHREYTDVAINCSQLLLLHPQLQLESALLGAHIVGGQVMQQSSDGTENHVLLLSVATGCKSGARHDLIARTFSLRVRAEVQVCTSPWQLIC